MLFLKLHYGIMSLFGALSSFRYREEEMISENYSYKGGFRTPRLLQCCNTLAYYSETKLTLKIKSFFP